jgi:5-methylcytosine-specific restriction protein A
VAELDTQSEENTMADRIRGRQLQSIRREHFRRNPRCVECTKHGRVRLAEHLDHIIPLSKGGKDDDSNRQGLCSDCHEAKTAKDLGFRRKVQFNVLGEAVDAHGHPIEW